MLYAQQHFTSCFTSCFIVYFRLTPVLINNGIHFRVHFLFITVQSRK
ncbi:hypothetical protein T12_10823, partial [Trichinella patagoniensis]